MSPKSTPPASAGQLEEHRVSLRAKIDQSGIEVSANSRLVGAVDRLLGGLVDLPGSFVEGVKERRRIREVGKTAELRTIETAKQIARDTKLAVREVHSRAVQAQVSRESVKVDDADLSAAISQQEARLFLSDLVSDRVRRVENKFAIVSQAVDLLGSQVPDAAPSAPPDEPAMEEFERAEPIQADWLNMFSDHAEKASSEELRTLWARILAGEVRKPGSFSPRTLRFVAELDRQVATVFQEVSRLLVDNFLPREQSIEGPQLLRFLELEEAELLSHVGAPLGRTYVANDKGQFAIPRGKLALIVTVEPGEKFQFPISPLTRTGREIVTILPTTDDDAALLALAELIKARTKKIELLQVVNRMGDVIQGPPPRPVWVRIVAGGQPDGRRHSGTTPSASVGATRVD